MDGRANPRQARHRSVWLCLPDAAMNDPSYCHQQTSEENLIGQIASREYLRQQFLSDDLTYIVFSLNGPITGEDGRGFVADVQEDRRSWKVLIPAKTSFWWLDLQPIHWTFRTPLKRKPSHCLGPVFISTVVLILFRYTASSAHQYRDEHPFNFRYLWYACLRVPMGLWRKFA